VGKHKLARWTELGSFDKVFQPKISDISSNDHAVKGKWKTEIFKNDNPVILELGCGKGEYSVGLATRFPENNYIGIDIKGARMWRGAKTADERKLPNIAFLRTRIEFINSFFTENEVDEIWITFPDPQLHKERKRLTAPVFLDRYKVLLGPKGILHLKTDDLEFNNYTLKIIGQYRHSLLFSTNDLYHSGFSEDAISIRTYYEMMWLEVGKKICYIKFKLNCT